MSTYTTKELVDKCVENNGLAQKHFYDKYSKRLFGIIVKYFDNLEDAEDVLIETIHQILTKMDQFKGGDDEKIFCGWMKRIAINKALSRIRYNKVNNKEEKMSENYQFISNDDNVENKFDTEYLLILIQGLSKQLRTVFNLYAIEGYSHREIGEMMGISESTSKCHYSRAKEKLQEKLNIKKEEYSHEDVESY